jgi:hypothetical protein
MIFSPAVLAWAPCPDFATHPVAITEPAPKPKRRAVRRRKKGNR